MSWMRVSLFGLLLLLVSCSEVIPPPPQDSYEEATLAPIPSPTVEPTATPIPGGAEGIGLAFLRAWEGKDYLGMYSLLSPQSQALVDSRTFVTYYQGIMSEATVQTVHAQPLSATQDGDRAEFGARVIWETAVVGDITRDHNMDLVFNEGRWGVVWDESLVLPELEGGYHLHMEHRVPARANIYDVNGEALGYQGSVVTLAVIPGQIEDEVGLLNALSPLLGLTPDEIEFLYAASLPDWYVPLGDITGEAMQEAYEDLQPFFDAGLVTDDRLTRLYTGEGIAPHIVGYTGYIPAEYVDEYIQVGYEGDEQVGLAGVEEWGEKYLSGTRGGLLTVIGPSGEYIDTVQETDPKQARSVFLSIEKEFQQGVEQALADAIESLPFAEAGSIVVLNPQTGAVLAMASYPDYDPVIFDPLRIDGDTDLLRVLNDPRQPLLNRAAQGEYPPGSTFKIVTFAAAVNSGLYTPDTRYTSIGTWNRLGDAFVKVDWRAGGHGTISLQQALVVSCNSCFYDAGYNVNEVDPFHLPNTARLFGYDEPTDIVGIPESDGLIPDPEWKINNVGEGWVPGDAVHMAIGQGYVQVTPLQMARLIAAIANGGTLYRPTVVDRIGAGGGAPEEPWPAEVQGDLPLTEEDLQAIQEALRGVANSSSGTATHRFVGLPVPVSGKTGTAETVVGDPHAWFAGYAPSEPYTRPDGTVVEEPELAVVVMVENAGEGSTVGAPLFRRVIELYYGLSPMAPFPWSTE